MDQNANQYEIGQWVVHSQYGVGQIKQIENIPLHGDLHSKEKCFMVQTSDGVFWFPVEENENPRIRPISSKKKLKNALQTLQEPPEDTDAHYNVFKGRINTAKSDGSLKTSLKLVRDILARNAVKKLNMLEERALKFHTDRLVQEWSLCMQMDESEVLRRFNNLLQEKISQTT